jgi:hypothetical protein
LNSYSSLKGGFWFIRCSASRIGAEALAQAPEAATQRQESGFSVFDEFRHNPYFQFLLL